MGKTSKRFQELLKKVEQDKIYNLSEAIDTVKTLASAKFNETVEIALKLNVDPRHADQMVRGSVVLPAGTGKVVRVAVIAKDAKADEAKAAGADIVGADDLVEDIQKGVMNFDVLIATPNLMGLVGKVGRILGPKGLCLLIALINVEIFSFNCSLVKLTLPRPACIFPCLSTRKFT